MDPRQPELALPRIKELVKQYEDLEKRISKVTVSTGLSQLEREGSLVVQEICLVAPRLHETLMNTSRNRRTELANGIVKKPVEKSLHRADVIIADIENPYGEIAVHDAKPEEYIEKPKKKTTKKKKAE